MYADAIGEQGVGLLKDPVIFLIFAGYIHAIGVDEEDGPHRPSAAGDSHQIDGFGHCEVMELHAEYLDALLKRLFAASYDLDEYSPQNDAEVCEQTEFFYISQVAGQLLVKTDIRVAAQSPKAGQTGLDSQSLKLNFAVSTEFLCCGRLRPDNRHFAAQDIYERRQYAATKPFQDAQSAALWARLRLGDIEGQLKEVEAESPDSGGAVENGAPFDPFYGEDGDQYQRQGERERRDADDDVETAFDGQFV